MNLLYNKIQVVKNLIIKLQIRDAAGARSSKQTQISDLLVQIDKPKSPRRKQPKHESTEARPIYNNDNRLYQNYKRLRDRALEREKNKIRQQIQTLQQFKVDNKHSIFLNTRNNLRPIQERTPQIIRDKELSIERKRTQLNIEKQRRKKMIEQQEQLENSQINQYCRMKSVRKAASKQEVDEIISRLTQRERQRHEKANRDKMDYLKQKLLNNKQKPTISKKSQQIWQKRKLQRQLSSNVFQRFDRYIWDNKKSRDEYVNAIKQKQTPFKPKISKNSIQILNKSTYGRTDGKSRFQRSTSCKHFQKRTPPKPTNITSYRQTNHQNKQNVTVQPGHSRSQMQFSPYRYE